MRTAEVEVNKHLTFLVNDLEHKSFKLKCIQENTEMAKVLRQFVREYVQGKQK